MTDRRPVVIVGHTPMAGHMALHYCHQGIPVFWLRHNPLRPLRTWRDSQIDITPPFFRRGLNTPHFKEPEAAPAAPLQVIWDRHRLSLEPSRWDFELHREFGETRGRAWHLPEHYTGTHHARQLAEALTHHVSFRHQASLGGSTLGTVLELSKRRRTGTAIECLEALEKELTRLGGRVIDGSLADLVFEKGRVWGVVLEHYLGVIPSRHVLLVDHLTSFRRLDIPAIGKLIGGNDLIKGRKYTFTLTIPASEFPEEFSGEGILLDHPDHPVLSPHAFHVSAQMRDPWCHLTVRQDCLLGQVSFDVETCRSLILAGLSAVEKRLCPDLPRYLESIYPEMETPTTEIQPLDREHFLNLVLGQLPDRPITLMPGCTWYGPEAWDTWFAPERAPQLPDVRSSKERDRMFASAH